MKTTKTVRATAMTPNRPRIVTAADDLCYWDRREWDERPEDFVEPSHCCEICEETYLAEDMHHDLDCWYCDFCANGHICDWCGAYADTLIAVPDETDRFCSEKCKRECLGGK